MSEKGSLKNKLKDFFKIQKKLLEKKKLEKEEKKKRKKQFYSGSKIFLIKLFSYLGLCISYFLFNQKKKPLINKNLSKKITLSSEIKKEVKIKNISKKNSPLQEKKIIMKQENLKNIKFPCDIKAKIPEKEKPNITEKDSKYVNKPINNHIDQKVITNLKDEKQDIRKNENKAIDKPINNHINEKVITNFENISNFKEKNLIEEKKKQETDTLKKIASQTIIIGALSSHLVGKVSKEIIKSIQYSKKENLSFNKPFILEHKKLEPDEIVQNNISNNLVNEKNKNEEQEEKQNLDTFYVRIEEIKMAHNIIQEELLEQEFEIEKLKEQLKNVSEQERKKIKLTSLKNTTSKLLDFFNPFRYLFRNSFISKLTHSILINHRVKKMRRIIENENKVKYYNIKKILKEIKDKKDIIEKNIYINLSTLEEINALRNDLLREDSNSLEIIQILKDLIILEKGIIEKNKKLEKELEKTKELEEKGKVKIKEFKNIA